MTMVTIFIVIGIITIQTIFIYNKLVRLRNNATEGWTGIDVQLKRRTDLVPNLVSTVKGFAKHENKLLKELTTLRAESRADQSIGKQAKTELSLSQSLHKLMVVAEAYPELKSDQNFLMLQKQLSEIENSLQKSRRYYNGTVRELNIKIESFPSNLVAEIFGFSKFEFFALFEESDRDVPQVKLS